MASDFQITVEDESPCFYCPEVSPITAPVCPACSRPIPRIGFDAFFVELQEGRVIDARRGGLVLGNEDAEDRIPMFAYHSRGHMICLGAMHGNEYVISQAATLENFERLQEINSEKGVADEIDWSRPITTINAKLVVGMPSLWFDRTQFIINRYATAKYLHELEEINATVGAPAYGEFAITKAF